MKEIAINLSIEEWNQILESLGQQPFNKVYKIIQKIQSQASDQMSSSNGQELDAIEIPQTENNSKEPKI